MSVIWEYPHNWKREYSETYEFKTELFRSRDGHETRRAMRDAPRVTRATVTTACRYNQDLAGAVSGAMDSVVWFPDPRRLARLDAAASASDTTISLNPVPPWVVSGANIALQNGLYMEVLQVSGVSGTSVTVQPALSAGFPKGAKVRPALKSYLVGRASVYHYTSGIPGMQAAFSEYPGSAPFSAPAFPGGLSYKGDPLFLSKPNWKTTPRFRMLEAREVADFGIGTVDIGRPEPFTDQVFQFEYLGRTAQESEDFVTTFVASKGRALPFWMPSWRQDMVARSASGNTITVEGSTVQGLDLLVQKNIYIEFSDSSHVLREVSSVAANGTDTDVTVSEPSALPAGKSVGDIRKISWLYKVRFASDKLTVKWRTSAISEVLINVHTLRAA